MKCIYKCKFYARCPTDNEVITYDFELESDVVLSVEFIIECLDYYSFKFHKKLFQENATQRILGLLFKYDKFGSYKVITKGTHSNVKIKCVSQINNLG